MAASQLHLLGVGLVGPGLASWAEALQLLRGHAPYIAAPTVLPPLLRLPPAERRRASASVKVAMAAAEAACGDADVDPALPATVFTASGGDGANCNALCEVLGSADPAARLVSPTRFTNSVHNAPAGYWHITAANREASTSLCAHDESFAAGLLAALVQLGQGDAPVLLVASDTPYPEPLHAARPLPDMMGVAFLLQRAAARPAGRSRARLSIDMVSGPVAATECGSPALEALRQAIPAARALPLLEAVARPSPARILVALHDTLALQVDVAPAEDARP